MAAHLPVAIFVDPGARAGVCELYAASCRSRFICIISEIHVPNPGCAWRHRSRLAEVIEFEWGGIEWPLVVIEQTQARKGRSVQSSFGLGLNTGVWAGLRGNRFDVVNAGTWKTPGWEVEARAICREHKLGRRLGPEKNPNAFDALALAGWYSRHHDIRGYAKFCESRPELGRVDSFTVCGVSWPPERE